MTARAQAGREVVASPGTTSRKAMPAAAPGQTHLTPEQQARFNKRLVIAEQTQAFRDGRPAPLRFLEGHEVLTVKQMLRWVAIENGVSYGTADGVDRAFRKGGIAALLPGKDPRRGRSPVFDGRPKLRNFVKAEWKAGLNVSNIADDVKREWGGPELPYKGDCPGPGAIRRETRRWPQALRDWPRLPQRKWESKHGPYLYTGRGHYTHPLEVWCGDDRLHDVLVANDCFEDAAEGAAIRLWETCIQDMRTRVIVGSVWSVNPSSRTIARALRQGISRFGKPELFYSDNGKSFKKIGAGARGGSLLLNANEKKDEEQDALLGVLAVLGIRKSNCKPFHPQAKLVESYFNFQSQREDPIFFRNGYVGRTPGERMDLCREQEKEHKEFLSGKRAKSPLYPASQFIKLADGWTDKFNREHKHTGDGMDGRAPMQVMDELLPPAQRIIPDASELAELAPFFWDAVLRKVRNCKVWLNNASYSVALDDLEGAREMLLASTSENGGFIAVRFDPEDPAYAVAFENVPGGRRLAFLFSDQLAAQQRMIAEKIKMICVQRATVWKDARGTWELGVNSAPGPIERLAHRNGMKPPQHYSRPALPERAGDAPPRYAEEFIEQLRKAQGE